MYPVSANFHTLAIADSPKTRCRIYFIQDSVNCWDDADVQSNGTLLVGAVGDTDSNGRIGQGGVTVTEIFNKDQNISIGGTVSYQIGMTLVNSDGALDNFAFGRCKVYLDVYDDANSTWLPCPLGVFRIELPVKRKVQLISCTGYDQMQVLNAIADTWWNGLNFTGGLTIANILNSMVTQLGLHLSATSSTYMVNTTLSFTTPPVDSVERTYRDILGWIAEATGTVAHFNRDGELDMRQYLTPQIGGNNIVIDTDTTGNQCLSIDVAEYSVSQIDALTIKLTTADQGVTVGSGTNVYTIMDNPFLYGPDVATIQGKLTPIYNRLNAYATYSPISTRLIYDWSIEAGDIIYIRNNSTTYRMPIFQQKMVWRGGYVTSELLSSGDTVRPQVSSGERETYRYNVEMATKVGDNEIISKINQTAEQITIQASKVDLAGYVTFTNLATSGQTTIDGGNITTGTLKAITIQDTGTNPSNYWDLSNGNFVATNGSVGGFTLSDSGLSYGSIRPEGSGTGFALKNSAIYYVSESGSERYVTVITGSGLGFGDNTNATPGVWKWRTSLNHGNVNVDGTFRDSFSISRLNPPNYTTSSSIVNFTDNGTNFYTRFNGDVNTTGDLSVGGNASISGNATVNGVLDVTPRRCYNTLPNAGWYRVLTFNSDSVNHSNGYAGSTIDFNIGYKGQNETHKISLHIVNGRIKFDSENSVSYSQLIDKIRYTRNGAVGYVDLHILGECPGLYVDFIVHDQPTKQYQYVAANLVGVGPSPSGETIVTEHTFSSTAYSKTVSAEGTANGWNYILYTDKTIDATRKITDTVSNYTTVNGFYGYYIPNILTPFSMSNADYYVGTEWAIGTGFSIPAAIMSKTTYKFNAYAIGTAGGSQSVSLTMHIKGTIA